MILRILSNAASCVAKWRIISSSVGGMGGSQLTTDASVKSSIMITIFISV
ncbi:hypothetical protein [Alistipes putredinis]|nr:hypothetical protein [Alistipes putredinis]